MYSPLLYQKHNKVVCYQKHVQPKVMCQATNIEPRTSALCDSYIVNDCEESYPTERRLFGPFAPFFVSRSWISHGGVYSEIDAQKMLICSTRYSTHGVLHCPLNYSKCRQRTSGLTDLSNRWMPRGCKCFDANLKSLLHVYFWMVLLDLDARL